MYPHFGSQGPDITDYADGFIAAQPLTASPTGTEAWEITGFSVRLRMVASIDSVASTKYWARWGDIWAGVLKDQTIPGPATATLPTWPPPQFPSDLSTLAKVWTGADDPIAACNVNTNKMANHTLITNQTVLPFPFTVNAGSQLAFAVIMGRSILDALVALWISEITYTVNYNTIRRR